MNLSNSGNRTDLKIYKISKSDYNDGDNSATAEIISYSYADQLDFIASPNNTNWDAEGLISYGDKLLIFSKNWADKKTNVYSIPKTSGTHSAILESSYNINGLVTGADTSPNETTIYLTGYSATAAPFMYTIQSIPNNTLDIFSGTTSDKILNIVPIGNQVEAIALFEITPGKHRLYISNERYIVSYGGLSIPFPAKLWLIEIDIETVILDDDGDLVMNAIDLCPNTPIGEVVDANGCSDSELDDDGDLVMNAIDLCPNTPTGEAVDADGCSESELDDDEDLVMNDADLCSNTPTGEVVDVNGCSESQLDDDEDLVMNNADLCPNTPTGESVDANGCFTLPSNNFTIETKGETCPDKKNGQILIIANEPYNYEVSINGNNYSFTDSKLISDLLPGTYEMCITISQNDSFEQCYSVLIDKGNTISGKSSITSNKASITIEKGTAPFSVYINGISLLNTLAPSFIIDVKHGDLIEVKTAISCEGTFLKAIDSFENITAYPNPSKGIFEIILPISEKEVVLELYTMGSQLISKDTYQVVNGKVQINLGNQPTGVYVVKIYLNTAASLTIIKE